MAKKKKGTQTAEPVVVALPEKPKVVATSVTDGEHQSAIDYLRSECLELAYQIHWFRRSKQATTDVKTVMAGAVGGTADGYSITRRLFSSKHPAIKELNARRKAIDEWRNSMTLVMASKPTKTAAGLPGGEDEAALAEDAAQEAVGDEPENGSGAPTALDQAKGRVARGMRLIRKADVKAFWDGFWSRVKDMMDQAAVVESKMEEIKDYDRKRQGAGFNEADYPTELKAAIAVEGPYFSTFAVTVDLPPAVYEAQLADVNKQLSNSVSTAAAYIANIIISAFGDMADQLVNRQRVHPTKASGVAGYENAELVKVRPAGERDGVKVVEVQLRTDAEVKDDQGAFVKTRRVDDVLVLPADKWKDMLRPTAVSERRKLSTSTVEKMLTWIENFDKVKQMLGSYGGQFDGHLDPVRTLLAKLTELSDGTAEGLADVLREGDLYRKDLANTLTAAAAGIEAVADEAKTVKRRLNAKYVGQI